MPPPLLNPSPPDPPDRPIKQSTVAKDPIINSQNLELPLISIVSPPETMVLTPEDKILAAWRKCASNRLPDGNISVHPAVFDMMEAFIESVKEFKEIIKRSGPAPTAPILQPSKLQHPLLSKPVKSWANAVKPSSSSMLPLPKPANPPSNRAINEFKSAKVIIRVPDSVSPLLNIQPKDLLCKINAALLSVGAKIDSNPIQALGASKMQSGDLIIHTANRPAARWLLWNRHEWTSIVHKDFVTSRPSYPVLLQSVPSSYDPSSPPFIQDLTTQNRLSVDAIQDCRWLVQPPATKNHGSVIVSFVEKILADKISRGDLFLDGLCLPGKKFDRSPLQCHQCQGIGHIDSRCRHQAICARCGEGHNTRDCANEDIQTCARCFHHDQKFSSTPIDKFDEKYSHSPKSLSCPLRKRRSEPIDYSDLYSSSQ